MDMCSNFWPFMKAFTSGFISDYKQITVFCMQGSQSSLHWKKWMDEHNFKSVAKKKTISPYFGFLLRDLEDCRGLSLL